MYGDVKYIVMDSDVDTDEFVGIKCFANFINKKNNKVKLYNAITGPKFLYEYSSGRKYFLCYELRTLESVRKYIDKVYILRDRGSYYSISKLVKYRDKNEKRATKRCTKTYNKKVKR